MKNYSTESNSKDTNYGNGSKRENGENGENGDNGEHGVINRSTPSPPSRSPSTRRSYSLYGENTFYRRTPSDHHASSDPALLQQALLPPTPIHLSPGTNSTATSGMTLNASTNTNINAMNINNMNMTALARNNNSIIGNGNGSAIPGRPKRRIPTSSIYSKHALNGTGSLYSNNKRDRARKGRAGKIWNLFQNLIAGNKNGANLKHTSDSNDLHGETLEVESGNGSVNMEMSSSTKTSFRRKRRPLSTPPPPLFRKTRHNINKSAKRQSPMFIPFFSSKISTLLRTFTSKWSVPLAVILWYLLGVLSISTTKLLLRDWQLSPLSLTFQQFVIGACLLRLLGGASPPSFNASSSIGEGGKRTFNPLPVTRNGSVLSSRNNLHYNRLPTEHKQRHRSPSIVPLASSYTFNLILSSLFFTIGFLTTNLSFSQSSASFVETIKASEPITSAGTAVIWGIEIISREEAMSLLGICVGVVVSTLGNASSSAGGNADAVNEMDSEQAATVLIGGTTENTLAQSVYTCTIVLISNLCFSFRGLYQKLYRSSPQGNKTLVNDLNLQYRMQSFGIILLGLAVFLLEFPGFASAFWEWSWSKDGDTIGGGDLSGLSKVLFDGNSVDNDGTANSISLYLKLALVNGFAFTSYNLASTFVLTRVSVVHHAALNCIRRLFAIVVTSIIFSVPITLLSALGIAVSISGFMAFTHFKTSRFNKPRPLSSLLPLSES